MMNCDPITGVCLLPDADQSPSPVMNNTEHTWAVHYIGDPMCAWCWGISPTVSAVEDFCKTNGIDFSMTMGGLRAGGGDSWNEAFKGFLHNEWRHIAQTTDQPFGFTLLEAEHFDYDTEPACRAVATVKLLQTRDQFPISTVLKFFSAIQHKFYVEGQDPKETNFYASICNSLALDFDEFRTVFESPAAQQAVQQDFVRCRQWGVRSFPTLLLEQDGKLEPLAEGFVTTEQVLSRLQKKISI